MSTLCINLPRGLAVSAAVLAAASASAQSLPIPTTLEDLHLSGTQVGGVSATVIKTSSDCAGCHGNYDLTNEPYRTWRGSLMAQAGRDPLYYAQMTNANQDVASVGYFCMRCHVPMSFVTTHANDPSGSSLNNTDRDGVTCHFCHSMVDPIYQPGVSPAQDATILAGLAEVPGHYGNAMFVLDPNGLRRGPYSNAMPPHPAVYSPFHRTGELCGTCHDVGNVAVTRQVDGTYVYNQLDQRTPNEDLHEQFPLERTYTEWKLSAFANGGVDMGGRFGGQGVTVVRTCQDCHMPRATARGCYIGPVRSDLARHEFAGASAWVLKIIGLQYATDPNVSLPALEAGQLAATSMVQRAASIQLSQVEAVLRVRVINESGHKLPTGHIEGRRVWVNARFLDGTDALLREYGHYDPAEAELDEATTAVYEMKVGLSAAASAATGLPVGVTTHMALADTIAKDTRIPPRGFQNASYEAAGAPVVGAIYADGQYWDQRDFWIPEGAATAVVTVYYQTVTRHYIETLRDGNYTDSWGSTLHNLWLGTDKGPPIPVVSDVAALSSFVRGDFDGDGDVDAPDLAEFEACFTGPGGGPVGPHCALGDFEGDRDVDCADWKRFTVAWTGPGSLSLAACNFSGSVPDGASGLVLAKGAGGSLDLSWGASCLRSDGDYAIYEGQLGDFASQLPVVCSTGGATGWTVTPVPADTYYLVVPRNASVEGSYGTRSGGFERPPSGAACLPHVVGGCP